MLSSVNVHGYNVAHKLVEGDSWRGAYNLALTV